MKHENSINKLRSKYKNVNSNYEYKNGSFFNN